ncbi:MAG: efflux RND transporter permease subunit [Parvularculaceae bacterium]
MTPPTNTGEAGEAPGPAGEPRADDQGFVAIFIRRPILAAVFSLLIVIAGLAALLGVEVRELPNVDQPVVSVRAEYPGASPETIDAELTAILEGAVAQVDGVQSISSQSRFGRADVTAAFSNAVDLDIAATDVKNAVAAVTRELPEDAEDPVVIKADADASPILRLAIAAEGVSDADVARLVDDVIVPRVQAVQGVALADPYGGRREVIRVRVFPASLAARGFGVADVVDLLARSAQSAASGRVRNDAQEILIRTETRATTPEEVANLRLDAATRLGDVAAVEWGFEDAGTTLRGDGATGVGIGVARQAQSNTVLVAARVKDVVEELNRDLPAGVSVFVTTDDSVFINRAIEEVAQSLVASTLIVVLIIFLFLGSARATLIPAVTIPIALLGTVAALWLAGFSINLLTLLALVMATGLVVDDAIVVTENVSRWRTKGAGPRAAAAIGAREIVFAVLSTTATLAAVFAPISFLPGQAGSLFAEFGFVLAFAVIVSSFVALTLCPMLTVKLASKDAPDAKPRGAQAALNAFGSRLARLYGAILRFFLRLPIIPIAASLVFAAGAVGLYAAAPRELTPSEDRGRLFAFMTAPPGASLLYLDTKALEIEDRLNALVEEGSGTSVISINGLGGSTRSFLVVRLADWDERAQSEQALTARARRMIADVPGVNVFFRGGNSLGIRGGGQGLQFAVVGDDFAAAAAAAEAMRAALEQSPAFASARLDFDVSQPQANVRVDREAATLIGASVDDVGTTIAAMSDEVRAAQVFIGDDAVDVMVSGAGEVVNDTTDLEGVFVPTEGGAVVPLSSLASIEEEATAATLTREQRRRAVPVSANPADGVTLGEAIVEMRRVARDVLPGNLSVALLGEARDVEASAQATNLVFGFAALIVFLVLAAQFESFVSAAIIMATVPFGLAAAVYAIVLTGGSLNYYSQIGLVMLIGIMAKNGILIVEFANQMRDQGASVREAAEGAAMTRLRPVAMTAISTLLGGLPLILAAGAGAESRAALGWVVVGGLGFATVFTLFLTPVAFLALAGLSKPRAAETAAIDRELKEAAALR